MTCINDLSVEEFSIALLTQVLSENDDCVEQAKLDWAHYEQKFGVVVFLGGMISGLITPLADEDGREHPPVVVWQQYLLDWQANHE